MQRPILTTNPNDKPSTNPSQAMYRKTTAATPAHKLTLARLVGISVV